MAVSEEDQKGSVNSLELMLKVAFVTTIFIIGFGFLLNWMDYPGQQIILRKFPYPYQAALALCSDTDGTDTIEEFLAIQHYLCSEEKTPWGTGLGLEVGNSFWFYDYTGESGFTIFDTTGNLIPDAASVITQFIQAGYIDVLHSYGNFRGAEFDPALAEKALRFRREENIHIPVWVNHADYTNPQSLGKKEVNLGDDRDSPYYHSYLLKEFGIRFIDTYTVTHIIGQDAPAGIRGWAKMMYEFLFSIYVSLKQGKSDIHCNNRLITTFELDDGEKFYRFKRFIDADGKQPKTGVDAGYISHQLNPEMLNKLLQRQGYMILYTHFGANQPYAEWLPNNTREALEDAASRFKAGELFITTTSRLLDYNLAHKYLDWRWEKVSDYYDIIIEGLDLPLEINFDDSVKNYQGITFYTPDPENTRIFLGDEIIKSVQINPVDNTGMGSVTIAWEWLEFPRAIDFAYLSR